MAESSGSESYDDFPEHLDPEMKERPTRPGSQEFQFKGPVRAENSLFMFLKRRPPRDFGGFVDAISMEATPSLQNRGVKVFNGLVNSPLGEEASSLQGSMENMLKFLTHAKIGPVAVQLLLTEVLPLHDYELNIGNIAACLTADNRAVRRDAASRLERLIIVTPHKNIRAYKNQLLTVAQTTYDIIHDDTWDSMNDGQEHLHVCGYLHLLALSALLCRQNYRPTLEECRPFMTWQKQSKRQTGDDVRLEILRVMHAFYESFHRHLKDSKSKMAVGVSRDMKLFAKADFCERISSLFLVLNKIAENEWSEDALQLVANLKQVCDVMAREGKRAEEKVGMNILLMRSLVVLLNSTYAKVRQQVGEGSYTHSVETAQLLTSVARSFQSQQRKILLPHLSVVAFHESPEVRHIVTELLDNLRQPHLHTALNYLQHSLCVADFQLDDRPKQPEEVCAWHTLKGRFGRELADCHLLVHAGQCKAKRSSSSECVDHPAGQDGEEWAQKRHNMEMLVKLSATGQGSGVHKYHNHLLQLLAFQNSPFLFYATEGVQGRRLLEELINHRAAHRWLSTSVLSRVMHDVISGLEFLASRRIASREITSYYMLVSGRRRRGGLASAKMDMLMTDHFTVKLTNLGLAHQFRGEQDKASVVRPVDTQGPIPLLWTPMEALLEGQYSEVSMVYSAGCVMFELWTHGCQPFTTYQKTTADTVRMMLLQSDSMPLIRWPCIPEDVHSTMRRCTATDPASRPSLAALKQFFMERHTRKNQTVAFHAGGKEQEYPSFSDDQVRRKHVPELGIPLDVQQVIDITKKNRNDSYKNMRRSRWVEYADHVPEGAAKEMNSPDWLEFAYWEKVTSVREKLPSSFVSQQLPLLEKAAARNVLRGVTDWLLDEQNQPRLETESPDHIVHERQYNPSWTLQDAVCKGMMTSTASGYVTMTKERYLHVLLGLARAVHTLHVARWLHRDIRASNVLVDCQTGEVTLARLGRLCQIGSGTGTVTGEPFEDSWRWLGPEVLSDGRYGRENDVFMFGTVVWEVFWCREVTERNPTATELNFLPFADQPRDNILSLVREKKPLPKPEQCPDWLYQLSVNCRDPDPAMRPFMADIVFNLESEMVKPPDFHTREFLPHPKLLVAAYERASAAGEGRSVPELPELPARFLTKHVAPFRDGASDARNSDHTPTARNRPLDLSSIKLDVTSTTTTTTTSSGLERGGARAPGVAGAAASQSTDDSGYLTPTSEAVKSVADPRSSRPRQAETPGGDGQWRRFSESDKRSSEDEVPPPLPSRGRMKRRGRCASENDVTGPAASQQQGARDEQRVKLDPVGGRVFRPIRGYPSGRGLPSVPSGDEDELEGSIWGSLSRKGSGDTRCDNVYDEI